MTHARYYPRYHSKDIRADGDTLELYVVMDSAINEAVTNPLPYHQANDYAGRRNNPAGDPEQLSGWNIGLLTNITP